MIRNGKWKLTGNKEMKKLNWELEADREVESEKEIEIDLKTFVHETFC